MGEKKHAKAKKFKVVEKSLKMICIIYDALLLYKAFIFPKPWSMFVSPCKMNYIYYAGIAALFH